MNQKLQKILDIIQQSDKLDAEQKDSLLKSVKDADKELEITTFKLERTEKVKKTTAILLEETIEELELKRKAVEAQNRELEIESALERVRTVAMSMQKPDDLLKICEASFKEFEKLGFDSIRNAIIHIPNEEQNYFMDYDFSETMGAAVAKIEYGIHPIVDDYMEKINSSKDTYFEVIIKEDELQGWREFRRKTGQYDDPRLDEAKALHYYLFSIGIGDIGISTFDSIDESQKNILKRFRNVFDLAYRRYADITQAEAQAREAQIQASLERVRSSAMAMHRSEELLDICEAMFHEFLSLGFDEIRNAIINIHNDKDNSFLNYDYAEAAGKSVNRFDNNVLPFVSDMMKISHSASDAFSETHIKDEALAKFIDLRKQTDQKDEPRLNRAESLYFYFYSIGIGAIGISTYGPINSEKKALLKRFRDVFNLSYKRYIDISNAEAQAREARIEASLEKVRSRSLAMHKTDELGEVAVVVFEKLKELGIPVDDGVAIVTHIEGSKDQVEWMEAPDYPSAIKVYVTYFDHPVLSDYWKAKNEGLDFIVRRYSAEESKSFLNHIFEHTDYKYTPQEIKDYCLAANAYSYSAAFQKNSSIFINDYSGRSLSEQEINVVKRFAKVFEQAYVRFLDLQKAEAQAREARIEASLEIVRSLALGMHKSEEVGNVTDRLFEELNKIIFKVIGCTVVVIDEDKDRWESWRARTKMAVKPFELASYKRSIEIMKKNIPDWFPDFYAGLGSKNSRLIEDMSGERRIHLLNSIAEQYEYSDNERARLLKVTPEIFTAHFLFFKLGYLAVITEEKLPEENLKVTRRFVEVFDFAYTRFLDITRAEQQARESQIEAALERVRAKAMAMHSSDDISDTMGIVFKELPRLGIRSLRCGVVILFRDSYKGVFYAAATTNESDNQTVIGEGDMSTHPIFMKQHDSWIKKENFFVTLKGEDLKSYYKELFKRSSAPYNPKEHEAEAEHGYYFSFSEGMFYAWTEEEYSKSDIAILERFKSIIDLTFRRYFDLKKAEAQARESEIQLALERVRARTMAMQHSNELSETASIFFKQLSSLGIETNRLYIGIFNDDSGIMEAWATSEDGSTVSSEFFLDSKKNISVKKMYKGWKGQKKSISIDMRGKELSDYIQYISEEVHVPVTTGYSQHRRVQDIAYFSKGLIGLASPEPQPEENIDLLERFAKVFDQTYTRFIDLQRAEAQAREAEIEAALERVRSRTMAMQRSEELAETAADFFIQLNYLGIKPYRFNIAIVDEQDDKCRLWSTTNEGKVIPTGTFIPLTENDVFNQMYEGWKKQQNSIIKISGENRIKWTEYIMKYVSFSEYRPENIDIEKLKSEAAIFSNFNFKQGFFVIHTMEDIDNKDLKILQRFANVFEQTYTRFLDLKQAEAQAKEAVKQASLDRVRAEIASMRTAEDLNRITPLIWRELTNLEVPFIRCGVFIVDEEQENVRVYLTTPDGKALGVLNLPFGSNKLTINTVAAWQKNEIYKEHWNKEEFISWTKSMMELGQVQNAETYQGSSSPPESLHLHFVPFSQGMLYVGDTSPLSEDKLDLVRTLAESFSIAYARYEDFRNLEAAKNKIELTLSELKSAQAQLIHSEKMASLGELTAGIAHEIKNPLNFVNNFSEISGELLSELKEEIEKNDKEEVLALLEDLKQNLEKINLHGKRADSIVKGMLLHSRGTAGEKTLTDINDLLDQYVNLGYHGMRAQNKEFNITIEKDYDESLGKINVVPQDISRVFLNLINNACYAAYDRKKNNSDNNFSPVLKVSTKNLNDKVEIRIGDNGNGIPKDNLGKIFQPFFTTKPTGEGTGLGLSLSYDIVTKVHNGELKVQTEEGIGTEFSIILKN